MEQGGRYLREFLLYMRVTLNRSPKTVEQYQTDLLLFFRYLEAQRQGISLRDAEAVSALDVSGVDLPFLQSVTSADLYEFLIYASDIRGNHAKARARKLSAIRSFFKYMTSTMHYLTDNPAKDIASPTVRPALPKYLSVEESVSLLNAVQNDAASKTRVRDYAIVTLFLNCGMRLSELVGINIADIDPHLRSMRVLGKGAKERLIYLNDACRRALGDYLTVRAQDPEIREPEALFLSSRHIRISNKTVQYVVYKYLRAAGLEYKHYSTHKLRHTAATLMYQTGQVDVRVLKDILGHEQLNTTQIYTHVSDAHMEQAMRQNPLAGIQMKTPVIPGKEKQDD